MAFTFINLLSAEVKAIILMTVEFVMIQYPKRTLYIGKPLCYTCAYNVGISTYPRISSF